MLQKDLQLKVKIKPNLKNFLVILKTILFHFKSSLYGIYLQEQINNMNMLALELPFYGC